MSSHRRVSAGALRIEGATAPARARFAIPLKCQWIQAERRMCRRSARKMLSASHGRASRTSWGWRDGGCSYEIDPCSHHGPESGAGGREGRCRGAGHRDFLPALVQALDPSGRSAARSPGRRGLLSRAVARAQPPPASGGGALPRPHGSPGGPPAPAHGVSGEGRASGSACFDPPERTAGDAFPSSLGSPTEHLRARAPCRERPALPHHRQRAQAPALDGGRRRRGHTDERPDPRASVQESVRSLAVHDPQPGPHMERRGISPSAGGLPRERRGSARVPRRFDDESSISAVHRGPPRSLPSTRREVRVQIRPGDVRKGHGPGPSVWLGCRRGGGIAPESQDNRRVSLASPELDLQQARWRVPPSFRLALAPVPAPAGEGAP